ncbi:MAG: hypothetical protein K1X56_05240 [Flavobacteriales bacterium]|nr:hypothetical protein [Flavobacteriales bacterium]
MKRLLPYLLLFLFTGMLKAQSSVSGLQQYNFLQYSVDQGLPQSQVNAILEDSRGFLWFATQGGGVARFDGKTFLQYEEKDGLAGQIANCIAEDKNGNLWIGSSWGGLSCFNGSKFKIYDKTKGLPVNEITCLLYDKFSDQLFIGTVEGLTIYDQHDFTNLYDLDGTNDFETKVIYQDADGKIYIGTDKGIFVYDQHKYSLIPSTKGMYIRSISSDETSLWIATDADLMKISKKNYSVQNLPLILSEDNEFINADFTSIYQDDFDQLWFGTIGSGVFLLRNGKLLHFTHQNGLPDENIGCLFTESSGRTWFGTRGSGAVRFNGFAFNYFNGVTGLGLTDIFSIVRMNDGALWVASMSEGLFRYDGNEVKQFTRKDGLPSDNVRVLVRLKNNDLLIGTREGMSVYNGSKFTNYFTEDGLPDNNIRCLMQARDGRIWIGTAGFGLAVFDGKKFERFTKENGLNHDWIHSLLEDSKGNIYIGTGAGLNKLSDGIFTSFGSDEGLCNTYVSSIAEDKFGNIWVGTDKCISRFNGRRFTNYDVNDGLSSGTVYLLAVDKKGDLIVGTNKGFDKIRFTSYGQIANIRNYSKSEGFLGIECNNKSVLVDDDGCVWFGTVKGLIKYNPSEDPDAFTRPLIHITGVKLFYDDKWMKDIDETELDWFGVPAGHVFRHDQNNISFSFTGVCMDFPERVKYSFMLEGFDKQWSPLTSNSVASYSNLPPGKYIFKVKAKSANGLWSQSNTEFAFEIDPAFWQTWWFFLIVLISLVYGVYYINTLMQRNVLRHNEILEEKVNIRTREILKQKEEKELLLKEIHHRVKNNMQVIVSLLNIHADYIKDPESLALIEDSKSRIKSMALIHEKLYETKNFSKVNIGEYMETLVKELVDTYGLNTAITIDKKIDSESFGFDTIIPLGLLLNEIVSNSLKYAFPDRKQGTIYFHLKGDGKNFELMVGDDGVGFPKDVFYTSNKTLGVDLIRILADQLNGSIEILDAPGTRYFLRFENIDKQRI